MPHQGPCPKLVESIAQTLVIAYKEPTEQLAETLSQAGCQCTVFEAGASARIRNLFTQLFVPA